MNNSTVRVAIEYDSVRKPVIFQAGIEETEMIQASLEIFHLDKNDYIDYELIILDLNCKATDSKFLLNNDVLVLKNNNLTEIIFSKDETEPSKMNQFTQDSITDSELQPSISNSREESSNQSFCHDESFASDEYGADPNDDESPENAHYEEDDEKKILIDLKELNSMIFINREEVKEKVSQWCGTKKFKVSLKTQEHINQDGVKITTLICNKKSTKNCLFHVEFRTDSTNNYKLHSYWNIHNHELDKYDNSSALTPEILNRIRDQRLTSKSYSALTEAINKSFQTNFHPQLIYYQVKMIEEEEFGQPSEDADKLVKLLEQDSRQRSGFYKMKVSNNNQLTGICYMSKRMRKLVEAFSDVIILDTSHKTNRFNLPLLDEVAINNLGRTTTCYFSLIEKQTYENYIWALEALRSQMQSKPRIIFSDDEEALTKGKINFISY